MEYCHEEKIFLIKCEVEGFEPEVLTGESKILEDTLYFSSDTSPERLGQSTFNEVHTHTPKVIKF
jgi:hypothetical protein